jgi:alpha-tubulin suppressor-like RCC1 family protein
VSSGGVVCWGQNERGQLGDGTTTARGTPAPVAVLTGIVELTAGDSHFCARSGAGAVSCWGDNEWLQTGQTTRGIVTQPQPVVLSGPASGITAGAAHTCALVAGQSLCWGHDESRQLGNDTTYDRLTPVLAATGDGVSRTWSEVDASNRHSCGRDASGAVFCWGVLEGQGDNDTLAWLPTRWFQNLVATDMAGGWLLQCAVTDQQVAWCEGWADPRVQLAASGAVTSVVVAGTEACVLQTDGAVSCELDNLAGGALTSVPLPSPAVRLAASDDQVCALDNVDAVYCWSTWYALTPQQAFEGLAVTGVYGNSGPRVCVTTQSAAVACRSSDDGTETTEPTGGVALLALAVGDNHTCGITASGAAWCWGSNARGQLGDGTTMDRTTAVAVQGGHVFTQLAAGSQHTCGLTAGGAIYCWGYGGNGSMGDNHRDESAAPVTVDDVPDLTRLGGAVYPTCALDGAGTAWCWPTSFGAPAAHQIGGATGLVSTTGPCGLRATGEMLCWGSNYSGWFGDGTYSVQTETAVPGGNGIRFSEVSFGSSGTACGIALDGTTYCWGNAFGTSLGSPDSRGDLATLPLRLYGAP